MITTLWVLLEGYGVCMYLPLQMFILCKCKVLCNPKNRLGKQQTCRYWQWQCPEIFLTRTQSWSELECDTDFLGTTGRREVQLAHKQEMAGATTQWGFLCAPSPPHDSSLLTYSPPSLISQNPSSHPASPQWPPTPPTLYSSPHIPQSISSSAPSWPSPSSWSSEAKKLKWKQEVINHRSVPFTGKTNCWDVLCVS